MTKGKKIHNRTLDLMHNEVVVAGFRSKIIDLDKTLDAINNLSGLCTAQIMDANGLAGKYHVLQAIEQSILSFERKNNISKDLGLEICLRAAGERQISKALNILGVKNGHQNVCLVLIGCDSKILEEFEDILGERDDQVLEPDPEHLIKLYGLSKTEIKGYGGIKEVLIERSALLSLEK